MHHNISTFFCHEPHSALSEGGRRHTGLSARTEPRIWTRGQQSTSVIPERRRMRARWHVWYSESSQGSNHVVANGPLLCTTRKVTRLEKQRRQPCLGGRGSWLNAFRLRNPGSFSFLYCMYSTYSTCGFPPPQTSLGSVGSPRLAPSSPPPQGCLVMAAGAVALKRCVQRSSQESSPRLG